MNHEVRNERLKDWIVEALDNMDGTGTARDVFNFLKFRKRVPSYYDLRVQRLTHFLRVLRKNGEVSSKPLNSKTSLWTLEYT